MNIVLTGCTGFIGQHLAKALHQQGHHVVGLIRASSKPQSLNALRPYVHLVGLPEEGHCLAQLLAAHQPQLLIHLAAHYEGQHQAHTLSNMLHTNIVFATQVLDACVQLGVKQFINTGTAWQHRENKSYCPVNLYAASKQAFETLLIYYTEHLHLNAITLKLFDTYGPNDARHKLFYTLRQAAFNGTTLNMSPGNQLLDLLYIDDVVAGFLQAIAILNSSNACTKKQENQEHNQTQKQQHGKHQAYFLSSGQRHTLQEVVALYWSAKISLSKGIACMEANVLTI